MTIRRTFTATTILLVSALASAPVAAATASLELKKASQLLNLTAPQVSAIYTALEAHQDHIETVIADRDKSRRLTWREFVRVRNNARATVKAITPQLGRRKAELALFTLNSALLPQSILPRQRLGVLFEREKPKVRPASGFVSSEKTATYPGLPFTGHYRR